MVTEVTLAIVLLFGVRPTVSFRRAALIFIISLSRPARRKLTKIPTLGKISNQWVRKFQAETKINIKIKL
jgi:hypothetical protein